MRTAGIFVLLALASIGCGEVDCPTGSEYDGRRCVLVDGGGDGSVGGDAATRDGGSTDGAPARDGCTSITFYRDADDDGFGDPSMTMEACVAPDGYVADSTDCDDGCVSCVPGGTEDCDGADNDCDGAVDEGMLQPTGEPVVVSSAAGGQVDVATYGTGYIVVFEDADDTVRYVLLDQTGSTVSGSPLPVDAVGSIENEDLPQVAVFGAGPTATALVAWRRSGLVRVRSIPISGASPPPAFSVVSPYDHSAPRIAANDATALVTWIDGPADVWGQQVDPVAGTAIGDEVKLYGRTMRDFSPAFAAVGQDVTAVPGEDFFLLGFTDQRPADEQLFAYVDRVFVSGGVAPERTPLRLDTGLGLPVLGVLAAHARDVPDGVPSVAMTLLSDDESPSWRSDVLPLAADLDDIGVGTRRELSSEASSPGSTGRGLVSFVTVNSDAPTSPRMRIVDIGLTDSAGRSVSPAFGEYANVTAAIARAGGSDGAVVFTASPSGPKTLYFQALGCGD